MTTAAQIDLTATYEPQSYLRTKDKSQMVEVRMVESDVLLCTDMRTGAVVQIHRDEIDRWVTVTPLTPEDRPS